MSVPARIWQKRSATADVRVKRGSTEIIFAFRARFASMGHLNPQGWFSAGLPPMMSIMSVFFMSTQPLVIAPRSQVWDRGAVSNSGLIFQVHDPQGAHGFHNQIEKLIGVGTATDP